MVVTLLVTANKEHLSAGNERRFDESLTIESLKGRLEAIVGSRASDMRLSLRDRSGQLVVCELDDDARQLGSYPIADYMTLFVNDVNAARRHNEFTDVSQVEKYEMPDDEYAKRTGTRDG